jgi:hypothetical protein
MATIAAFRSSDQEAQKLCVAVEWEFADRDRGFFSDVILLQRLGELAGEWDDSIVVCEPIVLGDVPYYSQPVSGTSSSKLLTITGASISA